MKILSLGLLMSGLVGANVLAMDGGASAADVETVQRAKNINHQDIAKGLDALLAKNGTTVRSALASKRARRAATAGLTGVASSAPDHGAELARMERNVSDIVELVGEQVGTVHALSAAVVAQSSELAAVRRRLDGLCMGSLTAVPEDGRGSDSSEVDGGGLAVKDVTVVVRAADAPAPHDASMLAVSAPVTHRRAPLIRQETELQGDGSEYVVPSPYLRATGNSDLNFHGAAVTTAAQAVGDGERVPAVGDCESQPRRDAGHAPLLRQRRLTDEDIAVSYRQEICSERIARWRRDHPVAYGITVTAGAVLMASEMTGRTEIVRSAVRSVGQAQQRGCVVS